MRGIGKYIGIIITALVLNACKGDPPEQKTISMDDFAGETGEETFEVEEIDSSIAIPEGPLHQFVAKLQTEFDTTIHGEFQMLDRFSFSQREKINFRSKTNTMYGDVEVTPRAEFYYYTFADTNKTKNALYNWLDCFGSDCAMVKLNEDMKAIKTPPLFSLVYDTLILIADYRCEDKSFNWGPFEDSLVKEFGKNYRHKIQVGCGGPLNWK